MIELLLLFAVTEAFFSASPGPAVVMVVSAMLKSGWGAANRVIFGVLLGNLIYFVISCVLLLTATHYNEQFFLVIKLAGAAYLVYMLVDQYAGLFFRKTDGSAEDTATDLPSSFQQQKLFLSGLTMQLANPKTILFFSAFLPQFIHVDYNIPMQFGIMAGLSWCIEYTILIVYASGTKLVLHRFSKWGGRLDHIGNITMMIAVGWSLYTIFY